MIFLRLTFQHPYFFIFKHTEGPLSASQNKKQPTLGIHLGKVHSPFLGKVTLLFQPKCPRSSSWMWVPTSNPKKACTLFVLSRQSKQLVLTVPLWDLCQGQWERENNWNNSFNTHVLNRGRDREIWTRAVNQGIVRVMFLPHKGIYKCVSNRGWGSSAHWAQLRHFLQIALVFLLQFFAILLACLLKVLCRIKVPFQTTQLAHF